MTRRILVTGGLGFIGSHLVSELLRDRRVEVTIYDDLSGAVLPPDLIVRQITQDRPGKLRVHLLPVAAIPCEPDVVFETIYHLASIVGPAGVLKHSGFIAESIITDTYSVIRCAQRCNARLVNVSTSEVYGGGIGGLCKEDTPRVVRGNSSARQEYAVGKLAAEVAIENLCRENKLNAVSVRPFNVAGIGQSGKGGFVLPRFIGQAILGQVLTVFGDGTQIRAFTDVRDIVSGMILCADFGETGIALNLGNPNGRVSIVDLAERVIRFSETTAKKQHVDPKAIYGVTYAEAADKFPDASNLLSLGWSPRYSLDDTIKDTLAAMRNLSRVQLLLMSGLSGIELKE